MRWACIALLLAGCQSGPQVNLAIGYRVTIIEVDTDVEVTGEAVHPPIVDTRITTYADIAPGRTR